MIKLESKRAYDSLHALHLVFTHIAHFYVDVCAVCACVSPMCFMAYSCLLIDGMLPI